MFLLLYHSNKIDLQCNCMLCFSEMTCNNTISTGIYGGIVLIFSRPNLTALVCFSYSMSQKKYVIWFSSNTLFNNIICLFNCFILTVYTIPIHIQKPCTIVYLSIGLYPVCCPDMHKIEFKPFLHWCMYSDYFYIVMLRYKNLLV